MNKICILISIFLLTASLSGCGEEQEKIQPSGKSIRIGFIGPVSGPDKVLGGDSLKGGPNSTAYGTLSKQWRHH